MQINFLLPAISSEDHSTLKLCPYLPDSFNSAYVKSILRSQIFWAYFFIYLSLVLRSGQVFQMMKQGKESDAIGINYLLQEKKKKIILLIWFSKAFRSSKNRGEALFLISLFLFRSLVLWAWLFSELNIRLISIFLNASWNGSCFFSLFLVFL